MQSKNVSRIDHDWRDIGLEYSDNDVGTHLTVISDGQQEPDQVDENK